MATTETNTYTPDGLIAGDFPTITKKETLLSGQNLARGSVLGKLSALAATKDGTNTAPFNMAAGDTMVIDVDNAGNATATWDATVASITDTTTYAVTDQDGKTMTVTITGGDYDGEVQTVTFSGATTTAAAVAAGINAQVKGCRASVVGGQVKLETDGAGTDYDIACGAGTGDLTWGSSTAGTGDVGDIDAVTAAEVKTVIEADTTAEVTANADGSVTISSPTEGTLSELDFKSGNALTVLGFSVEVVTPVTGDYTKVKLLDKDAEDGTQTPYAVLAKDCDASAADASCLVYLSGEFEDSKLVFASGTTVADVRDTMRDKGLYTKTGSTMSD